MSSKREIRDYLQDILQAIRDINDFTAGMNFDQFSADRKTIHAVVRNLEIIGEDKGKSGNPGCSGLTFCYSTALR